MSLKVLRCNICAKKEKVMDFPVRQLLRGSKRCCRKCIADGDEEDVVIEPKGKHTHSVILLHGLYCRASDFATIPQKMDQLFGEDFKPAKGIRYIFPNAPVRTITWPDGEEPGVPCWYNYYTCKCGEEEDDEIDMEHWQELTDKVHQIIAAEVKELGDPQKVIVGGNSQGGTVACNVALTSTLNLGALFILRSNLLTYTKVDPKKSGLPVYIFTAELDSTFVGSMTSRRFQMLKDAGFQVTQWIEKDLRHEDDSECELLYAAKWIGKVFFQRDVEVTQVDRPDGPSPEEEDDEEQGA